MNQLLKDKLQIVAGDDLLISALRAVFDEQVEKEKPVVNENDTDEKLGQKYRAYETAKDIVEQAFVGIADYKPVNKVIKQFNKER